MKLTTAKAQQIAHQLIVENEKFLRKQCNDIIYSYRYKNNINYKADDLYQDITLKIFVAVKDGNLDPSRKKNELLGYFKKTIKNKAYDLFIKSKQKNAADEISLDKKINNVEDVSLLDVLEDTQSYSSELLLKIEEINILLHKRKYKSEKERQAINLRILGYTVAEIKRQLKISTSNKVENWVNKFEKEIKKAF